MKRISTMRSFSKTAVPDASVRASNDQLARLVQPWVLVLLVLFITVVAYIGTLRFEFVSDDEAQILGNRFFQSWSYVPRFFTGHAWSHIRPEAVGNYYRPIALLWLFLNNWIFGLNPGWWHLTTLLLHAGATLAVYVLVYRIVADRLTSGVAATVFGLHPVHIEAVAWVSGFTEPLLTIFCILAVVYFLRIRNVTPDKRSSPSAFAVFKGRSKWLALSLSFYGLALLTKETAIILPALIMSYEWIFGDPHAADAKRRVTGFGERIKTSLVHAAPYLALTIVYLVIRAIVLEGLSHSLRRVSAITMLLTWPSLLWMYAKHLIWPVGLSAFYDTPYVSRVGVSSFLLPVIGLACIAAAIWLAMKRSADSNRRLVALAIALLVLPILPLLNLAVLIEDELVHDRYLYIPSIGFAIILAIAVRNLSMGGAMLFGQPATRVIAILAITGALGFATSAQELHWANNLVLYHHSLDSAPNNKVAKNNLANELSKRGYCDDAIALYQELIQHDSNQWAAVYYLGRTYYLLGRYGEAEAWLVRGIQMRPMEARQYMTLAVTLQEMNRLSDAELAARRAIEIRPEGYGFHNQLADVLRAQGKLRAALEEFRSELRFNPRNRDASEQMAEVESSIGRNSQKSGTE